MERKKDSMDGTGFNFFHFKLMRRAHCIFRGSQCKQDLPPFKANRTSISANPQARKLKGLPMQKKMQDLPPFQANRTSISANPQALKDWGMHGTITELEVRGSGGRVLQGLLDLDAHLCSRK